MIWNNAPFPLKDLIQERLFRHHPSKSIREWNRLQQERDKERMRIARELHDTLLQGFLSASMQLCLADHWVETDSPAKPVLRRALDIMRKGIDDARSALLGLRAPALPQGSLEKSLCDVQNDFAPGSRPQLRIVIVGETRPLEQTLQEQVYLMAREALLNAFRHAQASSIETEIQYSRRQLHLMVRDNGVGFDPSALQSPRNSHMGLTGMRERAEAIGATIRVHSKRGAGTEVQISLPMRRG